MVETKELIRRAEEDHIIIDLCWVPGHVNVRGNEKADAIAKDAALKAPTAPHKAISHTDMRRPLREAITIGWHREWNSLAREGRKLREIKKDVKDWTSSHNKSRRIETVLARLRLGHTNITHVYLMQGQTEPPKCDRCRVTIAVKHLLLECRKYVTICNKYFRNPTLSDMLAESNDFSIDKLMLYLEEAISSTKYNSACDLDGMTSYSEIYLKTSTPVFGR